MQNYVTVVAQAEFSTRHIQFISRVLYVSSGERKSGLILLHFSRGQVKKEDLLTLSGDLLANGERCAHAGTLLHTHTHDSFLVSKKSGDNNEHTRAQTAHLLLTSFSPLLKDIRTS